MPSQSTHTNPTAHGSAAWVSPAQGGLVARAPGRSILAFGDAGGGLFRPRRTWGIQTWPTGRNWLVLGPPRSGKGAGIVVPALLEACDHDPRPTLVVTDPKGELVALAGPILAQAGYAVHVVAFDRPDLSGPWNPMGWLDPAVGAPQDAPDYGAVADLAAAMAPRTSAEKDPFWVNQAQLLLKSCAVLAWRLARERGDRADLVDVLALAYAMVGSGPLVEAAADAAIEIDPWAASQLTVYARGLADSKLAGNLAADMSSRVHSWTTPSMLGVLDAPPDTWDAIDILRDNQPHAVFVLATAGQASQQAVLWGSVIAAAHRIQRRENRLQRPLWLLLDELGNVGRIPGLADALATLPGAGVSIVLGLQALPQLAAVYGRDEANALIGAMHGYVALPGLGQESATWVSAALGAATVMHHKRSTSGQGAAQWDTQISQRPLLTPDEVSRLAADRLIVHRLGSGPTALRMRPYFADPRWAAQAALADPAHPQIAEALAAYRATDRPTPPGLDQRAYDLLIEMGVDMTPAEKSDTSDTSKRPDEAAAAAVEAVKKKTWSVPLD